MTPAQAKRYVLVGVAGAGVLSAVAVVRETGEMPAARLGVGVVVSGVLLSVIAEVQPSLAGAMALLMLTASAFVLGGGAWAGIRSASQISSVTN